MRLALVVAVALGPSSSGYVVAGVNEWTTNGPAGAWVRALAINPTNPATIYAGTWGGGVFKSTNGAGTWTPINSGLANTLVGALAVDPASPSTLYAGTGEGGVFKSTDSGASWRATSSGFPDRPDVVALAIDPVNPATLYAAVRSFNGGVFRSNNAGASWARINGGLTGLSTIVSALAIDPSVPAIIYAATLGGVYKSSDGGVNWVPSLNGSKIVLAISPSAPATLYAGGGRSLSGTGLDRSTNGGQTWVPVVGNLPLSGNPAVAVDPFTSETLYVSTDFGGVLKSRNGGQSWTAMNTGLPGGTVGVGILAIDPTNPAKIYAGTSSGVFDYVIGTEPCVSSATALCLNDARFRVTTRWATRDGRNGDGQAVQWTEDTGYFTFFDPANVELLVKILNGCSFNANYWAFAGGLTDVSVDITVTDTQTGVSRTYSNPQGAAFQPIQDTSAFSSCSVPLAAEKFVSASSPASLLGPLVVSGSAESNEPCAADSTTLCLNNSRFKVQAQWFTADGASGSGQVLPLTSETGGFWFFSPNNVEMVIKVLDGCGVNARYWTFAGGLTDVNVIATVTDTQTGTVKRYINPQGTPFQPIQDTSAFATCP